MIGYQYIIDSKYQILTGVNNYILNTVGVVPNLEEYHSAVSGCKKGNNIRKEVERARLCNRADIEIGKC